MDNGNRADVQASGRIHLAEDRLICNMQAPD
jgi:hypothetical protein